MGSPRRVESILYRDSDADPDSLSTSEVIARIIRLHEGVERDWKNSWGWAPDSAAGILEKSRLDRSSSLARTLRLWSAPVSDPQEQDARLILAWANLGALLEGTLKVFLAVFFEDYVRNVADAQGEVTRDGDLLERVFLKLWDQRKQTATEPGGVELDLLRQFFSRRVWWRCAECEGRTDFRGTRCDPAACERKRRDDWLLQIQNRRNAIHAFKDREVGTAEEFSVRLKEYLLFADNLFSRFPEPPARGEW